MINQQQWYLYGLLGMLPNRNIMAYISYFGVNITDKEHRLTKILWLT